MKRTILNSIRFTTAIVLAATNATAQNGQKVALAPVTTVSAVLNKIEDQPVPTGSRSASRTSSGLEGVWKGTHPGGRRGAAAGEPITFTIRRNSDGSFAATIHVGTRSPMSSVNSDVTGNHVRFVLKNPDNNNRPTFEGDLNPANQTLNLAWNGNTHLVLHQDQPIQRSIPEPVPGTMRASANPPVDPNDMPHKMDIHLADSVRAERLFNVLDAGDFKSVVPDFRPGDGGFDFRSDSAKQKFKQAGIDFVLVTTLEGFQDQTLDSREWSGLYHEYSGGSRGSVNYSATSVVAVKGRGAVRGRRVVDVGFDQQSALDTVFSYQGQSSLVQYSRETAKLQLLFLEVKCRLYDARTGELRDSGNYTFVTNRFYSAVANTSNHRDTEDLYLDAAKGVSASATVWLVNELNPITILKKEDKTVTINRGLGARLKVGGTYDVFGKGEELFDPNTHESLGIEEKTLGRVTITEIHEKFSKAMILSGDKGMAEGSVLRAATN